MVQTQQAREMKVSNLQAGRAFGGMGKRERQFRNKEKRKKDRAPGYNGKGMYRRHLGSHETSKELNKRFEVKKIRKDKEGGGYKGKGGRILRTLCQQLRLCYWTVRPPNFRAETHLKHLR